MATLTYAAWAPAGQSPANSALCKNPKAHLIPLTYECSFSSMGHPIFPVLSHFRTCTFCHHVFCKLMPHSVKNTQKSMITSFFLSGSVMHSLGGLCEGPGTAAAPIRLSDFLPFPCAALQLKVSYSPGSGLRG